MQKIMTRLAAICASCGCASGAAALTPEGFLTIDLSVSASAYAFDGLVDDGGDINFGSAFGPTSDMIESFSGLESVSARAGIGFDVGVEQSEGRLSLFADFDAEIELDVTDPVPQPGHFAIAETWLDSLTVWFELDEPSRVTTLGADMFVGSLGLVSEGSYLLPAGVHSVSLAGQLSLGQASLGQSGRYDASATTSIALTITDARIVGEGELVGGVTPVPTPASVGLIAIGIAIPLRRRRAA